MLLRISFLLIFLLESVHVTSDGCGHRAVLTQQLVSHGIQSRLGEWPWHAAVLQRMNRSSPKYACGGSVISSTYIVTAAHCAYSESRVRRLNPSELLIRTGITNIQQLEHSLQEMAVVRIIEHEDYLETENDIVLLKLVAELQFTDYVKPICLWEDSVDEALIVGKSGFVPGWGRNERGELPDQLQQATMLIVSRRNCSTSDPNYYNKYLLEGRCFCAGFRNGTSPGQGDSGGGLYIERDGRWILRGIVSNGKQDASNQKLDTSSYIVFTDISFFLPWINNQTGVKKAEIAQSAQDYSVCGKKKELEYSRLGVKEERMWPWQGDVYRYIQNKTWLCQAAIINEHFVLSPAEVYSDAEVSDPDRIVVVFNVFQNGNDQATQYRVIVRIIIHDQFDRKSRMNNLALLELKVSLIFSELIRPVCIWKDDPLDLKLDVTRLPSDLAAKIKLDASAVVRSHPAYTGEYEVHFLSLCLTIESAIHTLCYYEPKLANAKIIPDLAYVKQSDSYYLLGVSYTRSNDSFGNITRLTDLAYHSEWIEKKAVVDSHNLLNQANCNVDDDGFYRITRHRAFRCLASHITYDILLTTAACVYGIPVEDLIIRSHVKRWDNYVKTIHSHSAYDKIHLTNNIALVELNERIITANICLPKLAAPLSSLNMKLTFALFNGIPQTIANVSIIDVESCAERWRPKGVNVSTNGQHICGFLRDLINIYCWYNLNGAALVYYSDDGQVYLRGLLDVSRKNICKGSTLPEVFIDVMFYANWISTTVSKITGDLSTAVTNSSFARTEWRRLDGTEDGSR